MNPIKRAAGFIFWLYWFTLYFVVTVTCAILSIVFGTILPTKLARYLRYIAKVWGYIGTRLTFSSVTVLGKENITDEGCIIISNHQSLFDIFVGAGFFPKDFLFLAKKEAEKIPLIGYGMKKVGYMFIDRKNPRKSIESLKVVVDRVKGGGSVLIYPEGTRTDEAEKFLPFKAGTIKAAKSGSLPILPIVVHGTQDIKPTKIKRFVKPAKVTIQVLPVINADHKWHPAHVDTISDKDKLESIREYMIDEFLKLVPKNT